MSAKSKSNPARREFNMKRHFKRLNVPFYTQIGAHKPFITKANFEAMRTDILRKIELELKG